MDVPQCQKLLVGSVPSAALLCFPARHNLYFAYVNVLLWSPMYFRDRWDPWMCAQEFWSFHVDLYSLPVTGSRIVDG